jgi:hypothetical protein
VQRTMYFALILLGFVVNAGALECRIEALPSGARTLLTSSLPGWKIVTVSDLSSDDQKLWSENYEDKCPGIVEGNFSLSRSFAVSLIRRDSTTLLQTLVLLEPNKNEYKLHTLSQASKAEVPNIVLKFPPGTYKASEQNRSVRTKSDGIAYIKLEAAGTLYYKTANGFSSIEISE